ncbi:MAG: hypothetical protein JNL39_01095 [Opitutaceae bacterium]|nr:hypothetical protein [Opitutaceae bacterium]
MSTPTGFRPRILPRLRFALSFAFSYLAALAAIAGFAPSAHAAATRPGFERPAAPRSGPAPFLTEAVAWDFPKYSAMSRQLVYPTKNKTEAPFYDLPFAVNIPFEVPFDGGAVRVFFDVNIVWDEPEQAAQVTNPGRPLQPWLQPGSRNWNFHQQGIYRMDGAPIAAGSVVWEESGGSGAPPLLWQADAPFPLMLSGALPTAASNGDRPTRLDVSSLVSTPKPRRPFTDRNNEHDGFMLDRPIVLRPAAPGWYALWFTLNPEISWWPPEQLRSDDTLRARLIVHYMVARRERLNGTGGYFTRPDLAWLWEGATAPATRAIDPNLVRAHTVEIPLVLRRDGWVFDRAEIKRANPANDYLEKKLNAGDYANAVVKASAQPSSRGMTATYTSSIFERRDRSAAFPPTPSRTATMTWDITFPAEIMDGGAALIEARGGLTKTGGDVLFQNRSPASFHEDFLPQWIFPPTKDPAGVGSLLEVVRNYDPSAKAEFLSTWGARLGDPDGAKFWHLAKGGELPGPGQSTRFTLIARPISPSFVNAHNRAWLPMLYKDLGPQPLFTLDAGPWRIEAHYRRKKDPARLVTGAPVAGPATITNEKDEFWEWFPNYSQLLREKLGEVGKLETEIAIERELWQQERRTARVLLAAYQTAQNPGSWSDWFASSHTKAEFSEAMIARLGRAAGKANAAAFAHLTGIRDRIARIRQAHEAILAEIDRVFLRFIDRHPELTLYKRHQRALLEASDFKNALGTGDPGLFQAAMARANLQPDSLQPAALVAMAQLQIENGDTMGAIQALRSAVRQDPENEDARRRLRDIECTLIKVALDKSQGAIAQARRHFYGYLEERGFGERDHATPVRTVMVRSPLVDHLHGVDNGQWVADVRAPGLARYDSESAWAVFTTGVTGAVSGLLGRADQEARALDATERDMTVAFLGAHTILRLRMRGHTLEEIKSLTTSQIQEEITRGAANAPAMKRERAQELGLAIHQAFLLPELAALMSEDAQALRKGLASSYWNERDVGNTWAEWVGDLTSPKNLVMMLMPMSIGSVGGQGAGIAYWTRAEAAFVQGATRTGYADTGTMVVARMLQMDRALGAIGGTQSGAKLIKLLERSQQYQESLGLFGQAGWTLGKMVSVMALQGLMVYEAEQLGGPRAALLVEALLLFGGDTDLLVKFLDGARISRQTARLALDRFVQTSEHQQAELRRIQLRMVELQHQLEQRMQGKQSPPFRRTPPPEITPPPTPPPQIAPRPPLKTPPVKGATPKGPVTPPAPIGAANLEPPGPRIPNGQPGNDSRILLEAAEDGLEQGSDNGAIAASKKIEADILKEAEELAAKQEQARRLAAKLANAPPSGPLPDRPPGTGRFLPNAEGGQRLPPQPSHLNETWLAAERALFGGDYAEAERLYAQMLVEFARDAHAGKPLGPSALPPVMIKHRLEQARQLMTRPPPQVDRAATAGIMRAIPDSEVDAILAMPRGDGPPPGAAGSIAPTEGNQFIIKEVLLGGKLTPGPKELERMIQGEVIAAELNAILGQATPGTNVKAKWIIGADGRPEMQSASLIYRYVPGDRVDLIEPADLFHLRDQLAEHRVLATLLGDYDRKPDNYKIFNGVVYALDGGQADIMALRAMEWGPNTHPATIGGIAGNDHWYVTAYMRLDDPELAATYQKILLSELSLTYQAAERGIAKVKHLLGNPEMRATTKERLRAAFGRLHKDNPRFAGQTPEQVDLLLNRMAEDTLNAMDERLPATIEAMKTLNDRNGIPLPAGITSPRRASRGRPPNAVSPRRGGELLPFVMEQKLAA